MCSIPTELKFLRFSMNDGKSLTDGGRISGQIDNIEIFDYDSTKTDFTNSENSLQKIHDEDFSKCKTKNCDNWVLQNDDVFFIDT